VAGACLLLCSQNQNCLLTESPDHIVADDVYPGRTYSVDEQCQDLYGEESFFCGVSKQTESSATAKKQGVSCAFRRGGQIAAAGWQRLAIFAVRQTEVSSTMCSALTVVSSNIRFMQIHVFAEVSWRRGVKRQRGNQKRRFYGLSDATASAS